MPKPKVKSYPCFGGPLDGHKVTQQYAGEDYEMYNSHCRSWPIWARVPAKTKATKRVITGYSHPSAVLIYWPEGSISDD